MLFAHPQRKHGNDTSNTDEQCCQLLRIKNCSSENNQLNTLLFR